MATRERTSSGNPHATKKKDIYRPLLAAQKQYKWLKGGGTRGKSKTFLSRMRLYLVFSQWEGRVMLGVKLHRL